MKQVDKDKKREVLLIPTDIDGHVNCINHISNTPIQVFKNCINSCDDYKLAILKLKTGKIVLTNFAKDSKRVKITTADGPFLQSEPISCITVKRHKNIILNYIQMKEYILVTPINPPDSRFRPLKFKYSSSGVMIDAYLNEADICIIGYDKTLFLEVSSDGKLQEFCQALNCDFFPPKLEFRPECLQKRIVAALPCDTNLTRALLGSFSDISPNVYGITSDSPYIFVYQQVQAVRYICYIPVEDMSNSTFFLSSFLDSILLSIVYPSRVDIFRCDLSEGRHSLICSYIVPKGYIFTASSLFSFPSLSSSTTPRPTLYSLLLALSPREEEASLSHHSLFHVPLNFSCPTAPPPPLLRYIRRFDQFSIMEKEGVLSILAVCFKDKAKIDVTTIFIDAKKANSDRVSWEIQEESARRQRASSFSSKLKIEQQDSISESKKEKESFFSPSSDSHSARAQTLTESPLELVEKIKEKEAKPKLIQSIESRCVQTPSTNPQTHPSVVLKGQGVNDPYTTVALKSQNNPKPAISPSLLSQITKDANNSSKKARKEDSVLQKMQDLAHWTPLKRQLKQEELKKQWKLEEKRKQKEAFFEEKRKEKAAEKKRLAKEKRKKHLETLEAQKNLREERRRRDEQRRKDEQLKKEKEDEKMFESQLLSESCLDFGMTSLPAFSQEHSQTAHPHQSLSSAVISDDSVTLPRAFFSSFSETISSSLQSIVEPVSNSLASLATILMTELGSRCELVGKDVCDTLEAASSSRKKKIGDKNDMEQLKYLQSNIATQMESFHRFIKSTFDDKKAIECEISESIQYSTKCQEKLKKIYDSTNSILDGIYEGIQISELKQKEFRAEATAALAPLVSCIRGIKELQFISCEPDKSEKSATIGHIKDELDELSRFYSKLVSDLQTKLKEARTCVFASRKQIAKIVRELLDQRKALKFATEEKDSLRKELMEAGIKCGKLQNENEALKRYIREMQMRGQMYPPDDSTIHDHRKRVLSFADGTEYFVVFFLIIFYHSTIFNGSYLRIKKDTVLGCAKKHQPYLLIPFALTTIGAIGEKAWEFIEHVRRNGTDFMVPGRTREERSRRWASTLLCGLGRGLCIREATCVSSYSWNLIQKKEPKSKGSHLSF
ncbi:hypothetical protein ADUPG1_006769 [Aduncisulcus paluster]|uniref:Uncharacterized protein n=2 Tax=Aduncisulcus paluster TaxID=2918883 RepID=A0ABQ5KJI6_9EUKA|nr:hypothetical protein ADUPG1_006769 [Aduncisulcus paluster]